MKNKLFFLNLVLVMLFCFFPQSSVLVNASTTPNRIIIISDWAAVYENANIAANKITTVYFNQEFDVISESEGFYEISISNDTTGFIQTAFCLNSENQSLGKEIATNAVVQNTTGVFIKTGESFSAVQNITLEQGTRVQILKTSESIDNYYLIAFNLNEKTFTYFVSADNIQPDTFPIRTLIACLGIVACISALVCVYFIYYNRKKNLQKQI